MGKNVEIWTDGSCNNDRHNKYGNLGGWAFTVHIDGELIEEDLGFHQKATSSTMEMEAVIRSLEYCKKIKLKKCEINIHSDSAMIVNCFRQQWFIKWQENDYFGVKNPGLWKHMIDLFFFLKNRNKVKFIKVKGHSGIEENERVDFLAGEARRYLMDKVDGK